MTPRTDTAAQGKAPAGTCSNAGTKSSQSNPQASPTRSDAAIAGTKDFALKRTKQCEKCPWKKNTNPHDIPRGYDVEKHKNLKGTIAPNSLDSVMAHLNRKPLRIMACHEEHEAHCVGWLMHQLGPGNNIQLRIAMCHCTNLDQVELDGEQHESFEDTLPE